jgi:GxxExxY protein
MEAQIDKDEGYKLMAAAFEVYNDRGCSLGEDLSQKCLEIELELRGIPFKAKQELACHCKGRELKKRCVPDLFAFDCLVFELKAVSRLSPEHEAQLINYLRITTQPAGYLINSGHKDTLEWKRIILSEFIQTD